MTDKYYVTANNVGNLLIYPHKSKFDYLRTSNRVELHLGFYEFLLTVSKYPFISSQKTKKCQLCLSGLESNSTSMEQFKEAYKIFLTEIVGKNMSFAKENRDIQIIPRLNLPNSVQRKLLDYVPPPSNLILTTNQYISALNILLEYMDGVNQNNFNDYLSKLDKHILLHLLEGTFMRPFYKEEYFIEDNEQQSEQN